MSLKRVMQTGAGRAGWGYQRLGRFRGRQAQVVNQHDYGPMLNAEQAERAVQLVVGATSGGAKSRAAA